MFLVFDAMDRMGHLIFTEKLETVPVMLEVNELRLYSDKGGECATYSQATDLLRIQYDGPEKNSRILSAWPTISIYLELERHPEASEIDQAG